METEDPYSGETPNVLVFLVTVYLHHTVLSGLAEAEEKVGWKRYSRVGCG